MERYIGTDLQLEFTAEQGGTADGPTEELANVICDYKIVVCGGAGENVQLQRLIRLLRGNVVTVDEARYLIQPPSRGPRAGKGQRKAMRKDRWR